MSENQEKRPLNKVKVRVKRASESSRVSAMNESLSEKPDLIEEILPQALEDEVREEIIKEENKASEPIVFVSVKNDNITDKASETVTKENVNIISEPLIQEKNSDKKISVFTPFSKMSIVRKVLVILCAVFCLWSLLPLVKGIIGIGMYAPLFIGLFALFTVTAWDFITSVQSKLWKLLWLIIAIVAMAGATAFAFVSGHMISASNNTAPTENNNITIVVLGCKVNGTKPSKMLEGRLDKAAEYLLTHPGVNCIVTGGMGSDEDMPEAVVMKQYLMKKGVSASRIKTEDASHSTRENLKNALEVAKSNNYYTTFYIVTDRFHQLRAKMICNELDITSYALSCRTPWYLTMYYWFREMFGVAHHTVYKN